MAWCVPFAFVAVMGWVARGPLRLSNRMDRATNARSFAPPVLSDDRPQLGVSLTDRRIHIVAPGLEGAAMAEGEGVKPPRLAVHQLVQLGACLFSPQHVGGTHALDVDGDALARQGRGLLPRPRPGVVDLASDLEPRNPRETGGITR